MKTKQCDLLGLVFLLCFQTAVLGAEKNGDLLGTAKGSGDRKPSSPTSPTESVLLLGEPTVARTSGLTQRFFAVGRNAKPSERIVAMPIADSQFVSLVS